MRVRALSVHADYRCAHSGVCCSSGWDIPAEPAIEAALRLSLDQGRLRPSDRAAALPDVFRSVPGLPHGAGVVFARDPAGRCVFLDPDRRCAVHRQLGEPALASACRQFPRIVTLTPLGVSVSLSHFCPTAAERLFREDLPLRIVESPPAFPPDHRYEGLDARESWPPLLRPGVLASWAALERLERFAIELLAREGTPEAAVSRLAVVGERLRSWRSEHGDFDAFAGTTLEAAEQEAALCGAAVVSGREAAEAWRETARAVPGAHPLPSPPPAQDTRAEPFVQPGWAEHTGPVRRWLASRVFASWLALQGQGLRSLVHGLRLSLGVLWAEAARGCVLAERPLDAALLREAIQRTDLLLVHLADPRALADRLGRCEP